MRSSKKRSGKVRKAAANGAGRGAKAAVNERNLVMRVLLYSPKDTLAATAAAGVVVAIVINAIFLQVGRHPSPLFAPVAFVAPAAEPARPAESVVLPVERPAAAAVATVPASPLPRPRPAEAEARAADPIGNLMRSSGAIGSQPAKANAARSADPVAGLIVSSQRVAAVQRALTDYGYGQIKATGTVGADTQAAILKFERERKLPPTGQVSERLVQELGLATGRTFE
ncbi:MAG: peptidoglycan-binding domain-containing protein [Xanthobacteraceae bacterium]